MRSVVTIILICGLALLGVGVLQHIVQARLLADTALVVIWIAFFGGRAIQFSAYLRKRATTWRHPRNGVVRP